MLASHHCSDDPDICKNAPYCLSGANEALDLCVLIVGCTLAGILLAGAFVCSHLAGDA